MRATISAVIVEETFVARPQSLTSIGQPVPELPVADVERAQQHYRDALGFEIGWLHSSEIGAVSRGNVAIFLRKATPPFEAAIQWVFAEDIDATYDELKSLGANIVEPLEKKPWGLMQFTVEDIDLEKDLRVTDNGDGTLTILVLATGNAVMYGPNGKAIAGDPGQTRFELVVDHGGTPNDPDDDELLDFRVVKDSTGRSDDFCAAAVSALS